jgi:hypothetical protein
LNDSVSAQALSQAQSFAGRVRRPDQAPISAVFDLENQIFALSQFRPSSYLPANTKTRALAKSARRK